MPKILAASLVIRYFSFFILPFLGFFVHKKIEVKHRILSAKEKAGLAYSPKTRFWHSSQIVWVSPLTPNFLPSTFCGLHQTQILLPILN